ncbi:MAG TPA: hypothetical protein VHE12_01570 [bacterium]|nr:hypothetical protein [bacterium]
MKELINQDQADLIILVLSILVTLAALGAGAFFQSGAKKTFRKAIWAQAGVGALTGPAIWVFWTYIYNPIEDHYGLDSLKALKINFFVALGFGALFVVLHYLALRWAGPLPAAKGSR